MSKVSPIIITSHNNNEFVTPGISFASNADSLVYDEYGRYKIIQFGFDPNGGLAEYDKAGRLVLVSSYARSIGYTAKYTYKNNLIAKITLETYYNVSRTTDKTVTNVKYEYKHKKKK